MRTIQEEDIINRGLSLVILQIRKKHIRYELCEIRNQKGMRLLFMQFLFQIKLNYRAICDRMPLCKEERKSDKGILYDKEYHTDGR